MDHEPNPPRPPRRNRVLVSVGSLLTVAMVALGAAAFAAAGGGAADPEAAVRSFAGALDAEDALGAFATFAPDETRSLPQVFLAASTKLDELQPDRRGGGAGPGGGGSALAGLDITVDGLELKTTPLADDLAKVEIVGGTIEITTDVDAGSGWFGLWFPFFWFGSPNYFGCDLDIDDESFETLDAAAEADDLAAEWEAECLDEDDAETVTERIDFAKERARAERRGDPVPFIMTVQRGGWYVSPFFTAAEWYRVATDGAAVDYAAEPGPAASTPAKAVEALATAVAERDVRSVANTLASEMAVWRVYAKQWDADLDDLVSFAVDDLRVREEPIDRDRVRVVVERATITTVVMETDWDAFDRAAAEAEAAIAAAGIEDVDADWSLGDLFEDPPEIEVVHRTVIDGNCITTSSSNRPSDDDGCWGDDDGVMAALGLDQVSMVAVAERDGWAVSPVETFADYLRRVVDRIDRPLFERLSGELWFGVDEESGGVWGREPSARLGAGRHAVELDAAGVGVVEVGSANGDVLTVEAADERNVRVEVERAWSNWVVGPRRKVAVFGRVGDRTATIVVSRVATTDLTADGALDQPVTGVAGEPVAFRVPAETFPLLDVRMGNEVDMRSFDRNGADVYLEDPIDEPLDGPVTVLLSAWDDDVPGANLGYAISLLPAMGGFSGADPSRRTIDIDPDDRDVGVSFWVVGGTPVNVAIDSDIATPFDGEAYIECGLDWESEAAEPSSVWVAPYVPGYSVVSVDEDQKCSIQLWSTSDAFLGGQVHVALAPAP